MNRKIILLPLASFLVLGLGSCGKTTSSSSTPAASESASASTSTSASASASASASTTPVVTTDSIKDIKKLGNYTIKAVIVAQSANSVLLDDGTGRISYFNKGKCGDYVIGDYYKVVGAIAAANYRYGNFQFTDTATFTKLDSSKAPAIDKNVTDYDATKFDTWFASMKAEAAATDPYVEATGVKGLEPAQRPLVKMRVTATVSGTYYNFAVDGSTHNGGFTMPTAGVTIENAKVYDVTGYLYEVVAQKYGYLWAVSAEEYIPDVVVTAAGGATSVKVGATLQLSAAIKDGSAVASWVSDKTAVATVDATGLVTGVAAGTAVITATSANGKTGTISIDVSAFHALSELSTLTKGTAFESRGVYMGMNNKVANSKYQSVYVADGATWYQLYQVATTLIPTGLVAGTTVLNFVGTTADYTKNGGTTPEATVSAITVVTDATVKAGTPLALNKDSALTLAATDVNKEVVIADAKVKTNTVDAKYGNLTIVFTVGTGTAEYTLYLDSRYTDVTVADLANLVANDTFTCKSFVGLNGATAQFVYTMDFVRTAA